MRLATYPLHLTRLRQRVNIEHVMLLRTPDGSPDGRSIPFETLQVERSLHRKGSKTSTRHDAPYGLTLWERMLIPLYQACQYHLYIMDISYAEEMAICQDVWKAKSP